MDNGEWTLMRFPGLAEKPAVYIVGPDNSERLARQHGDGDSLSWKRLRSISGCGLARPSWIF